ncbi:UDP-galactopyranose mutase [Mucilaginibacter phyllosphaerae]|uniref:UDP-galactopyranose mutase n=1 Tax=Mucilaginibacter phyllosphaerae TaxID=1812349 RepID=A0A4Y8AB40_9SPHI|nr:UDP-galactopyranose mutase [Mucilaginibacter phyllosphaerae]MBB3969486.1 UDP-galactopyranose mutase [Mucilaginibacter phyllosphaerae]TEW65735.1 UDP-galactopyranose mutase [Mucilaginibacter phyllosphaerae]
MKKYDYLIVGSGLFGSVFAHEAAKRGKRCLVIDKRPHAGGNIYCGRKEGINIHQYGAHIFHTNDKSIWEYVNSFVEFNRYTNSPIAFYKNEVYNMPFNMNTFFQLWGVKTPREAKEIIRKQIDSLDIKEPANLEEQALSLVGVDIYEKLIKGYTEKQWGRPATQLPAFIIKRLPVRLTYDNNYFTDRYQGIPIGGYNKLTEGLLKGIELQLGVDYFEHRKQFDALANYTVFTGKIDQYYHYRYGQLQYRSLRFEHQTLDTDNYQGNAVVNYTEAEVPYTRIIEHKHFEFGTQPKTVITKEYPEEWTANKEPYYPINDERNNTIFKKYKALADKETDVIFGGRLAEYKYYDMHQIIGSALKKVSGHFDAPVLQTCSNFV